jgi:hypothetical protein
MTRKVTLHFNLQAWVNQLPLLAAESFPSQYLFMTGRYQQEGVDDEVAVDIVDATEIHFGYKNIMVAMIWDDQTKTWGRHS